jgi:peroxiredoxin
MQGKLPYFWVNDLLIYGSAALILAAGLLLSASFVFRRFRKSRVRWAALGSFLLGVLFFVSNYGFCFYVQLPANARAYVAAIDAKREASSLVKRGDPAPAFSVKTLDGGEFALDQLRGKTVLVVFFATWCGPCIQELPHVEEIWKANKNRRDFALVVIGREETDEKLAAFKKEHGFTLPIAGDPQRQVYSRYAGEFIPRSYLIGPDGTIRFTTTGYDEELFAELREQLANELEHRRR